MKFICAVIMFLAVCFLLAASLVYQLSILAKLEEIKDRMEKKDHGNN